MNFHAVKAFVIDKLKEELSDKLTYHGLHHTLDVLYITEELCYFEKINPYDSMLLRTAALYHDSGFTINNLNHEILGCKIAQNTLPEYGYSPKEIEIICGMIMATKIPQNPQTHLEQIICDADLDYLGRDDFYFIGRTLFEEFKAYSVVKNEEDWNKLQVKFLESHTFFTQTNRQRRTNKKEKYITELKAVVANYPKK